MSAMLFALIFPRAQRVRVHMTFPLNEMYGYSQLCDRLRSSAICDPRSSAIVCDHMETSLNSGASDLADSD